ncbi:hypothetical protein MBLNU459_g5051t1 [Dothideomycetes sp. NU459]
MATHGHWTQFTPGTEVAKTFADHIHGKTIVITGVGPNSLGETLATTIAKYSPEHLVLASRTKSKLDEIASATKRLSPDLRLSLILVNLSSQESVRSAAEDISRITDHIDILINNAGVMDPELHHTQEGIELQFGTNHIGHFLFTNLLMPKIIAASEGNPKGSTRIVNVTSQGHRLSPVRFHDYNFEGKPIPKEEQPPDWLPDHFRPKAGQIYSGFLSYGQCKTANILFSLALTERLAHQGIRSYAVHPGSIHTDLSRNLSPKDAATIEKTGAHWINHDQGTSAIMVAALDPALSGPQKMILCLPNDYGY